MTTSAITERPGSAYSSRRTADLERALRQLMHLTVTSARAGEWVKTMQAYKNAEALLATTQGKSTPIEASTSCFLAIQSESGIHRLLDRPSLWQRLTARLLIGSRCWRLPHGGKRVIAESQKGHGDEPERQQVLGPCVVVRLDLQCGSLKAATLENDGKPLFLSI